MIMAGSGSPIAGASNPSPTTTTSAQLPGQPNATASGQRDDAKKQRSASLPPANPFVEEIDIAEIEHLHIEGKGSFGTVYKGVWRQRFVAVKYFDVETERTAFMVEIRQMSRVTHPNIVRLFGACSQRVCLVMEFAECGSLYNALYRNRRLRYGLEHAFCWAKQCARGVAYLHAMRPKPLIHRDLKTPNLLLVAGGAQLKICDFGTVTDKATMMTNNKGSAAWMAPEVFEGSTYTERCDVYSWGIVLWELLSRQRPFHDIDQLYSIMWSVHQGRRPPLLEHCPPVLERLITACWAQSPASRPPMDDVLAELELLERYVDEPEFPLDFSADDDDADDDGDSFEDVDVQDVAEEASPVAGVPVQLRVNDATASQHVAGLLDAASARWASPEARDNSMPRIISEPLRRFARPAQRPMEPLSVFCEPNAWDLAASDERAYDYAGAYERRNANNLGQHDRQTIDASDPKGHPHSHIAPTADSDPSTLVGVPAEHHFGDPSDRSSKLDLDSMYLMLEPNLRPATPDANSRLSQQIFDEHNELAREYLKVQTEIAYVSNHREELLAAMDAEQRRERLEYAEKLIEKESLVTLEANLKRQLHLIRTTVIQPQQQPLPANAAVPPPPESPHSQQRLEANGWVFASSHNSPPDNA